MYKQFSVTAILAFSLLMVACTEQAPANEGGETADPGIQEAVLATFDQSSGKVVQLAEAMSVEQYDWRPAEGIRSVKEAAMHVASANFFFGTLLGADIPEGVNPQTLEAETETKEEALATLNASIEHIRGVVANFPAEDLMNEVDLFGNESSNLGVMLLINDHMSEHLGQLIAYARSNDVTPPWSEGN